MIFPVLSGKEQAFTNQLIFFAQADHMCFALLLYIKEIMYTLDFIYLTYCTEAMFQR